MQLSVIIVNYNVKFFLEHCLHAALKAASTVTTEIFVVDNNSTDGSEQYLSTAFPTVHFLWNKTNVGFGKACNSVLPLCEGEHILFLNPDTIVGENCFADCISFFKRTPNCGALAVKMIDGSGAFLKESKRSLPTAFSGFFKMTGLATLFPTSTFFAGYYAGHLGENEVNKVEILAGAFMMLSKKAIEITNGFDESFFMFGEDVDLSYRILKAGFQNYYLGTNSIIHFKGESTQKLSASYIQHFYGAMQLFTSKHYGKNFFQRVFIDAGIASGKAVAFTKLLIAKKNTQPTSNLLAKCVLISGENHNSELKLLLQDAGYSVVETLLAHLAIENFESILSPQNFDTIVFVESPLLSYETIIEYLPKVPKGIAVLFYGEGLKSVIGSNDKNKRGIFISIDQ